MTATIMSQDILGIFLMVSGGELKLKLGDAINHVEEFQERNNRHFGITRTDLRTLFWRLLWEKFPGSLLRGESESNLYKVNLQNVALDILKYQDAYFNDEGEHWGLPIEYNPKHILFLYDCSEAEFNARQAVRKSMIKFFQGLEGKSCPASQVQNFLVRLGFNRDTLYACSRPGDAS